MSDEDCDTIEISGTLNAIMFFFMYGTLTHKAEALLVAFLSLVGLGHLLKGLF